MPTPLLRHARKSLIARAAAGAALAGALVAGSALPASAETTSASASAWAGDAVLATAHQFVGTPYVYGGSTPAGFDCSGFTGYVLAQHGVALPRTADQQMRAAQPVSAGEAAPGDLVFFIGGGRAYHAGIYAGDGQIYDSGTSGGTVSKRAIWTSAVVYGRVLA